MPVAAAYSNDDVLGTLRAAQRWWALVTQDRPEGAAAAADGPGWAAADALGAALELLWEVPEVACEGLSAGDVCALRAAQLHDRLAGMGTAWPTGRERDHLDQAFERLVVAMRAAARGVTSAAPASIPTDRGRVERLARSDGGVPKAAVDQVQVGPRGLAGDRQADRRHHGRPWQALCLWSADVVESLRAEGHPVEPGSCGENVLVRDIRWGDLRPGMRLHLGPEVVVEVSAPADPCRNIAGSFLDRDFGRIGHQRHPWTGRLYAWVEQPGALRVGDAVRVD